VNTHQELWAKQSGLVQRYPLAWHLLDTATVALVLWDRWLRSGLRSLISADLGSEARAVTALVAGLHDIGKANPCFAGQLTKPDDGWVHDVRTELAAAGHLLPGGAGLDGFLTRHERVSAVHLLDGAWDNRRPAVEGWLGLTALGHHGSFAAPPSTRSYARFASGTWKDARDDLVAMVYQGVDLHPSDTPEQVSAVVTILLSGLTILADRIASSIESVTRGHREAAQGRLSPEDPCAWVEQRYEWFAEQVRASLGEYQDIPDPHRDVLENRPPRPLQTRAEAAGDGLWMVMAPTGSGKTETALLRHAMRPERLIFLLPTQATTNAMMKRLQRYYRNTSNVAALGHSLASLEDFYNQPITAVSPSSPGGLYPTEFVRSSSARLLAPVTVSTVDQALMGSLPLKWTHLRLLALANAHVVVDEVHTMDQYQTELLQVLMTWWGHTRTRVTTLTATLPSWQRDTLARAYEPDVALEDTCFPSTQLVPSSDGALSLPGPSYLIDLEVVETSDTVHAHTQWVSERRHESPDARLGVICNTINRAQEVAQAIQCDCPDLVVLHSRMTAEHRRRAAARLAEALGPTSTGGGITVVGTQAIEASLDIDLDALSTDLAPAPSLLQRAGRVWRRDDPDRARRLPATPNLPLRIVRGDNPGWHYPYFAAELQRTWNYLEKREHLRSPQENQVFIEASAFSLDEARTEDDYKEIVELAHLTQAAKTARYRIDDVLHAEASVLDFAQLTRDLEIATDEVLVTRLIDTLTVKVILLGDPAVIPGAWPDSIDALERICPEDKPAIRQALQASLGMSGALAHTALSHRPKKPFAPKAPVLLGYIPLEVGELFDYHPVFGVTKLKCPQ